MAKENIIKDIHKDNKKRCIIALTLCIALIIVVFLGVVLKITGPGDNVYEGKESFRYFTILSNILVALCATLCIPFEIDGLRNENYHLPRWIVNLLYVGVCTVATTFVISAFLLAPTQGFYKVFIKGVSPIVHFICPILSIILFIFINDDHQIKKQALLLTIVPLALYGTIYVIEVFRVGRWVDHYQVDKFIPVELSIVLVTLAYILIAYILKKYHNKRHQKRKQEIREYYLYSDEVSYETIEEAIEHLAKYNKKFNKDGDINVPRRIILMMNEKYKSEKSISELCEYYIKCLLD